MNAWNKFGNHLKEHDAVYKKESERRSDSTTMLPTRGGRRTIAPARGAAQRRIQDSSSPSPLKDWRCQGRLPLSDPAKRDQRHNCNKLPQPPGRPQTQRAETASKTKRNHHSNATRKFVLSKLKRLHTLSTTEKHFPSGSASLPLRMAEGTKEKTNPSQQPTRSDLLWPKNGPNDKL